MNEMNIFGPNGNSLIQKICTDSINVSDDPQKPDIILDYISRIYHASYSKVIT